MNNGFFSKNSHAASFAKSEDTAVGPVSTALSRGQRAMWFLWNLNPDGAEYGLPMAWMIRSAVNIDALQGALQDRSL